MRILVIGGTRFIGPPVVKSLVEQGHELTLFHRGQGDTESPTLAHIHGERERLTDFADEFARLAPELVLDMVARTEQDARLVMQVFTGIARRVVTLSSGDAYRAYGRLINIEPGPLEPMPLTEDSPVRERLYPYRSEQPRSADDPRRWVDDYDKVLVERIVMGEPELPGTILRLPAVFGAGDYQHRLFEYLKRMDDERPFILLEEAQAQWRWSRAYVQNVADAITLAVTDERAAGRIYNVAEPVTLSEVEWVRHIAEAVKWQGQVITLPKERMPAHLAPEINLAQDLIMDSTRIRRELGYAEPVPLEEALARTVEWERANPPAEIDPANFDYAAEDQVVLEAERRI